MTGSSNRRTLWRHLGPGLLALGLAGCQHVENANPYRYCPLDTFYGVTPLPVPYWCGPFPVSDYGPYKSAEDYPGEISRPYFGPDGEIHPTGPYTE